MEEINKAYATFEERDRIASLGGGVDKIEKQPVARCLFTLMTLRYMAAHCQLPMLKRL